MASRDRFTYIASAAVRRQPKFDRYRTPLLSGPVGVAKVAPRSARAAAEIDRGKQKLGATLRMGERTIWRLLILGVSAVFRWASQRGTRAGPWLAGMLASKPKILGQRIGTSNHLPLCEPPSHSARIGASWMAYIPTVMTRCPHMRHGPMKGSMAINCADRHM